ncbi:MAG: hypothetical protein ACR2HV_04095 [Acidimicrobiales bacterium]
MADLPDIWSDPWPEAQAPPSPGALRPLRPIGGQAPRFGVARDLDLIQRGAMPPASRSARALAARRRLAPPPSLEPRRWDQFRTWWADSDLHPAELWHRRLCRLGRHDFQGGRQIQLAGRFVNTERCCVWCQATPE